MVERRKLIIDCDPGQDDAINLFMALSDRTFDILGITTSAGNVGISKTTRNARLICDLTNRHDIPVYAGAKAPIKHSLETAEFIHGVEGLDGIDIFEPAQPVSQGTAKDFIISSIQKSERPVTLVVTGPMTNVALALMEAPDITNGIDEIVLMGGAFREGGNMTPSAEFNIFVDPYAAQIVFETDIPKIVFGLDVTYQVLTSPEIIEEIAEIDNTVARAALGILRSYERTDTARFSENVAPLHDPCTIAWLLRPEIFELKPCNIRVEADSELTRGHTAVDFWNRTELSPNCHWAYKADRAMFFDLLKERLAGYGA